MSFPFSQACSPMPTAATMLALCAFSVSSFGPARPPHDDHSLVLTSIRMRSHRIFFTMRMRISPSKSACAVTNFLTMRMRISPSHGCGLRSYTHAVALVLIETESSCDEVRRVTAMRTTSSGIHIRSDDDEKKILFFLIRRLSFVSGALLGRLNVSVSMSFLRCKLFGTPPPPARPPSRSQNVPYRCRPALAAPVRQKKEKRKQEENENNQWKKIKNASFLCF